MTRDEQIRDEAETRYPMPKKHSQQSDIMEMLQKAYTNGANRNGWIRVEDGLPDESIIVYGWKSHWKCGINVQLRHGVFYDTDDGEPWDITHYQYLPTPPQH